MVFWIVQWAEGSTGHYVKYSNFSDVEGASMCEWLVPGTWRK
jgi:hypothetical protein